MQFQLGVQWNTKKRFLTNGEADGAIFAIISAFISKIKKQNKQNHPQTIVSLAQNMLLIWKDRPDGKKVLKSSRLNKNDCL